MASNLLFKLNIIEPSIETIIFKTKFPDIKLTWYYQSVNKLKISIWKTHGYFDVSAHWGVGAKKMWNACVK